MYKVKRYIICVSIMVLVSMVLLVVLTTLTYIFKWQADKAMVGIIVTYVMAGVAGGVYLRKTEKGTLRKKLLVSLMASALFIMILEIPSFLIVRNEFLFSGRFLLVWLLITCSVFGGMCGRES